MEKTKRKIMSYLLVLLMVLTICPYRANAAEPIIVTDETELRAAVANAQDGDTIRIVTDVGYLIRLSEADDIVITKDITLEFAYGSGINCENSNMEAALIIKDCEVTITGDAFVGGYDLDSTIKPAILVKAESGNAALNIDDNAGIQIQGAIKTEATSNEINVTINNGSYSCDTSCSEFELGAGTTMKIYDGDFSAWSDTIDSSDVPLINLAEGAALEIYGGAFWYDADKPLFGDLSGATLVVNGGRFKNFDPTDYLGENYEVADNQYDTHTEYEVRSSIRSDAFKKMLSSDGKLVINSAITPNDWAEAFILGSAAVEKYSTDQIDIYANPADYEAGTFDLYYNDFNTGVTEVHRVQAVYTGSLDNKVIVKAQALAEGLPLNNGNAFFRVKDLEVINMWVSGFNPEAENTYFLEKMVNYSGELKQYLGNSNFDFSVVYGGAGYDTDLYIGFLGDSVISSNGSICAIPSPWIETQVQHVIYVPDGTATTKEALIAAAQKRINDYLGDSTKVVLSYGGAFNTLIAPEAYRRSDDPAASSNVSYRQEMLDTLEITAPDNYFVATVNGHQFKLLIIPDSSKMITPSYKTVDYASNVTITSDAAEIPLDTSIRASKLTSGNTYNGIIEKLGVDENVTFDLKLYSYSNDKYISSLSDDKFKVSIPIPDTLKGKDLVAYYVDADGKITKYPVKIVGNNAEFETNHFSIYTVAEGTADVCEVNGPAHKLTAVPAKAATTTAEGNKAYWTCDCGKWFADADGKTEITDKSSVIIPKLKEATVVTTESEDNNDTNPNTGDNANIIFVFVMLGISVMGILGSRRKLNK
ncbi:MAG: LPXTG cell wall anchor domain-containing protein [Wujia sp.]